MKNVIKIAALLCFMLSGLSMTVNANALVVKLMNLRQLTAHADLIFQGRVMAVDARWDEGRTTIWTYVTFSVNEVIKGNFTEQEITLRLPGGAIEAEDIRLKVDGVPQFREGEENLIFCNNDPENGHPIVGWHQGRFSIGYDKNLGQKVIRDKRAAQMMTIKRSAASAEETTSAVPLKEFLTEIVRIKSEQNPSVKP